MSLFSRAMEVFKSERQELLDKQKPRWWKVHKMCEEYKDGKCGSKKHQQRWLITAAGLVGPECTYERCPALSKD